MVRDNNDVPVKTINDCLIRLKESFEAKLNHGAPSIASNITDSFVEPYICCEMQEEIISDLHKLKANKTLEKDKFFMHNPLSFITQQI